MSSLAEALKSVTLKPIEDTSKDKSAPKLDGFLSQEAISTYQNAVLDVNTEEWLDSLAELSFPTAFCPISYEESALFVKIYEKLFKDKDSSNIAIIKWRECIDSSTLEAIQNLTDKLEKTMVDFLHGGYGFVKTSSRSAKDAPLVQERFKQLYLSELDNYPHEVRISENVKITCLLRAGFQAQKVKNATEVIEMFVRSERIYQDMLLATKCKERFNEHFVIRKFVHIDVDMEFRGFVYEGDLTALSQYNYLIHSEKLVACKQELCGRIKDYFQKEVKHRMLAGTFVKNYVIDFAVCDDKIWVIEINPFLETTDGALFDWNKERTILEGQEGFVFRVTERVKPGSMCMLPQSVRDMLKTTEA